MQGETPEESTSSTVRPGERLRAAREALGLDLPEIAARTRIPQRHLEAIEQGTYSGLPSITYATGFAKAYARAVNIDEVAIARDVRGELGQIERPVLTPEYPLQEPSRAAPGGIVWFGVIVALVLVAGIGIWYGTNWFRGGAAQGDGVAQQFEVAPTPTPSAPAPAPSPTVPAVEHVTLVARGPAWIRVTDATGKRLAEKELTAGERYEVPDDADHPRVRTGRPDQLQVLLNGSEIAPLGTEVKVVEAELTSAALRARGQPGATPSPTPGAAAAAAMPLRERAPRRRDRTSPPSEGIATPSAPTGGTTPGGDTPNP
ncbi:helix-turn-helix domain-containing protein [Sphingomonas sp. TDK1]|uniref:helix-turn-helix domain-containing protein n=1 Tax=Sphingomonas sp. TDK1 TaxID=453247 RepID=UPI0007DA410B|nr:helix-turn-helix domain-containing protein [Sphingomonas sp. TDK1]OAN58115.1 XRE family transcriptional regulator [Sphingomonas sp. TDK1]